MNQLLNGLKNQSNFTLTENGGITHKTTKSMLLDMFAMGAAMRNRSDNDVILMFKNAYEENPEYALKCLFYIRDVRGGQGERRFFRVCMNWLAKTHPEAAKRNMPFIAEFGRWDDMYCLMDTTLEKDMFALLKKQFVLDLSCETPSLLAKWLPSCNASSRQTIAKGNRTRMAFGLTQKEYRKALSVLRKRINVLERLMSAGKWDEIEFDKIPSKAGLIYKNAFARRDIIKKKYEAFAKDTNTKVNAGTLYPYEVVEKALHVRNNGNSYGYSWMDDSTDRAMVNKYWANLTDYFNGANLNALAVVDTSGSMHGTPINVAISLGMYCAEHAGGPFANHYISFASKPQLIECEGIDFVDKVHRIYQTNLVDNTNIEAVFDLLLDTAKWNNCSQDDLPQNILVISDMEFDAAAGGTTRYNYNTRRYEHTSGMTRANAETVMEGIARKWAQHGYKMPHIVYWNCDARSDNIPMLGEGPISYVSGFSPSIFQTILTGKTGYQLMLEALDSDRYSVIH